MPPTFFGRTVSPTDSTSVGNVSQSLTITPPGSMVAGDLVYLLGMADDTFAPDVTITNLGGQNWTPLDEVTLHGFNVAVRRWWCEFNGTWSANPVLGQSGNAVTFSAAMFVFRHGSEGLYWSRDKNLVSYPADPAAPFDLLIPTVDTLESNEVEIAQWASKAIHTLTLQTAGWTNPSGETQWRNPAPAFGVLSTVEETIPSGTDNLGTQLTVPGVAHTKSGWTQLIASTTFDAYWVTVLIHQMAGAFDSSTLIDVGTGAAASEVVIFPNLQAGWCSNFAGKEYNFPYFIPSGTRIAARVQSVRTTGGPRIAIILHGSPAYSAWQVSDVDDIGTVLASSRGTPVTATQNAEGTWTSLGVAAQAGQMLAVGVQGNSDPGTLSNGNFALDLGYGDPTPTIFAENIGIRTLNQEIGGPYPAFLPVAQEIPIDSTIWARMQTHLSTDLTLDLITYLMVGS